MLIAFLIMLREGIEAALIVGIVAGFLKQSGHHDLMPKVWLGVAVYVYGVVRTGKKRNKAV